jgi:hypothetical protein
VIATAIMGTTVVVLVGGLSVLINSSAQNRNATTAGIVARDDAEALEAAVAQAGVWCQASYATSYTPPSGYSVSVQPSACPANNATTPQFQPVTITATAPNGASESLTIAVRKP